MLQSAATSARIKIPNGLEIRFTGNSKIIGRGDLARALGLDELGLSPDDTSKLNMSRNNSTSRTWAAPTAPV